MKTISLITALLILFITLQSGGCNNVKELDYIGIKSTELESLGLNNSAIRVNLEYYNPNKFGIDVKETNLSIYLNDKFVAIADQPEKTQIPKLSNFLFPLVDHFNPLKILGTAFKSLFSKTNKVSIQGTAKLGKGGVYIKVPINITENVNLMTK
jgi:LEA14-like dessication related protein